MEEAGFADGLSLVITTNENPVRVNMATIMQQDLAAIGIDIEINVMEWGAMLEMLNLNDGSHELVILGWTTVTGDADYGLFPIYHSTMHGSGGNRSNFVNDRVDELLDLARVETDETTRLEAYAEVQEIIFEYAPLVLIDFTTWAIGLGNHVRGFEISAFGHHNFANITF
jgi:peptide/nickel transport system substrate-binding protein